MEPIELWIYRAIILTGVGLAFWLLQKLIGKVEELIEELGKLNEIMSVQKADITNLQKNCGAREKEVNRRFAEHATKINDHEGRIRKLE